MSQRGGCKLVRNRDQCTDCTPDCSSPSHAAVVLTSVALGNLRLLQHCSSLCSNPWRIADMMGRSPLHVAASRGHDDIVDWLVAKKKVAVDTADGESGWSALHRSVYFGELGTAVSLVKYGAGLGVRDNDGLTPLSLLNKDRLQLRERPAVTATDVYTWGSNANTTLGHAHSRPHPECLELPSQYTITQVVLEKFHSVLLTSCGVVLACGHGRGGRLGHGSEASFVSPRVVEALKGEECVSVAAARNHTVFLTHSGVVYSCGLNDAHQLGIGSGPNSTPKQCLSPTPINAKVLRGRQILDVGVGRYHTALATASHVYTFGQNLGQLGYEKNYPTQILPKAVPQISVEGDDAIVSLSASHAATAVLTKRHRIYVCCDFTVKTLRCGFLEKLQCRQFQVCASLTDRAHLRGTSPEPTKILLLDSQQKLWYWEPGRKGTVAHILPGLSRYNVSHFTLGKNLTIVTDEGEVFLSAAVSGQPLSFSRVPHIQNARAVFTDFKATNFAYLQNIYGALDLPIVAPPTLTSDLCSLLKEDDLPDSVADVTLQVGGEVIPAHRFILSLLSSHPLPSPTLTLPSSPPHILHALLHYLYGGEVRLVPIPDKSDSHISSHLATPPTVGPHVELTPDTSFTSVDENDLTEMYDQFSNRVDQRNNQDEIGTDEIELTDRFDWLHINESTPKKQKRGVSPGDGVKGGGSEGVVEGGGGGEVMEVMCVSVRKDLQALMKLATDLQVPSLTKRLDGVLSNFSLKKASCAVVLTPPPVSLSPSLSPTLTDITIHTNDHQSLHCHKCVLVARSDYFKSMLLMGWRESSDGATSLSLPFSSQLLSPVIHFMYTDTAPSVVKSDRLEWIVQVLIIADQLLLTRLRDICEQTLAKKLTLRSVCDILEVSATCSAQQLKRSCLQFIGTNAAALLEARLLDSLSPSLQSDLSNVYKQMIPTISRRVIKFPDPDPSALPESYFLEGGEEEEERQASMERDDDISLRQGSPVHTTPSSSGGRRRRRDGRRRKSSQSEARKSGRSSISPSPTPTSSPLSPLPLSPSSAEEEPERYILAMSSAGRYSSSKVQTGLSSPQPASETSLSTPKSAVESCSSRLRESASSSAEPGLPRKRLVDSYCDSAVRSEGGERGRGGRGKRGRGERGRGGKCDLTNETSPPGSTKQVWGGRGRGRGRGEKMVSGSQAVSLRDIMAEEEGLVASAHSSSKFTNTAPTSHTVTRGTDHTSPPPPSPVSPLTHHPSPRSLPASRQPSSEYVDSRVSLSSSLPRSAPSNPWCTAGLSTSPVMSLRDLMAEESQRAEHRKRTRPHPPLSATSSSPHPSSATHRAEERRRPSVPQTTPPVSFADIILSQQREQEAMRGQTGKPLSCIQIEEQAINQLEALYHCRDNPDEYITVQRYHPPGHTPSLHHHHSTSHTHHTTNSPWNTNMRCTSAF